MKRFFIFFALILLALSLFLIINKDKDIGETVNLYVNNEKTNFDLQPRIIKKQVMVPARTIADILDADISWDNKSQEVVISDGDLTAEFILGNNEIQIDDKTHKVSTPPTTYKSNMYLPIGMLTDQLGYDLAFDSDKAIVHMNINKEIKNTNDTNKNFNNVNIPVLMYHHFTTKEAELSSIRILPSEFEKQLQYLKKQGFETVTDQDVISYIEGKRSLPKQPVLITIDDGYESNYTYAYPIIKKLKMKATVYVVGSAIRDNNDSPYPPNELPKLSWEQAQEMYNSGLIEIQSHSYDMHRKGLVEGGGEAALITKPVYINEELETIDQYKIRVKNDLLTNKNLIEEKIGNQVVGFAYPFGEHSEIAESLLIETGHQLTLTIEQGINKKSDGSLNLNRITVPTGMTGEMIEAEINKYNK